MSMPEDKSVPGAEGDNGSPPAPMSRYLETVEAHRRQRLGAAWRSPALMSLLMLFALLVAGLTWGLGSSPRGDGASAAPSGGGTGRAMETVEVGARRRTRVTPPHSQSMVPYLTTALGFVPADGSDPFEKFATPTPRPPPPPFLKAVQYADPGEGRPKGEDVDAGLKSGDYVTVMPVYYGYEFLYFLILGPDDKLRFSRYYPRTSLGYRPPPLKIRTRGRRRGLYQIVLLATGKELVDIMRIIQDANHVQGSESLRETRLEAFKEGVNAALPETRWTLLPLAPYPFLG